MSALDPTFAELLNTHFNSIALLLAALGAPTTSFYFYHKQKKYEEIRTRYLDEFDNLISTLNKYQQRFYYVHSLLMHGINVERNVYTDELLNETFNFSHSDIFSQSIVLQKLLGKQSLRLSFGFLLNHLEYYEKIAATSQKHLTKVHAELLDYDKGIAAATISSDKEYLKAQKIKLENTLSGLIDELKKDIQERYEKAMPAFHAVNKGLIDICLIFEEKKFTYRDIRKFKSRNDVSVILQIVETELRDSVK